jgi:selenocysteine lyase/cysteine desulfurase
MQRTSRGRVCHYYRLAMSGDSTDAKLRQLRELLPATGAGIYLDTASGGPLPAETAAAMREAEDWELTVGRVWEGRDEDVSQRAGEARAVLAALLGADPGAITLTHGTADALRLAETVIGRTARVTDVTNAAGAVPVDVSALDVDAVVLSADRWLLGPEGTGALWLADPVHISDPPQLPRTALIGLARSVGWLEMYVGLDWAFERTAQVSARLRSRLAASGVELLESGASGQIVTFRLPGWTADEAAEELSRRVHALIRPIPDMNVLRASVAWFNTEDELDRFADAVAELAWHTPATLPRRPSLILLADS